MSEIRQFELRLNGDFNFNYADDTNLTSLQGEALIMAGFIPKVSDVFFYELRNGKIGVFYIGNVRRLALGQDTYHQVSFTLRTWLTADLRDRFKRATKAWYVFDKQKFLVGNHAFLVDKDYICQKDLRQLRVEIIQNYTDRFYTTNYASFMRPDGLYDPYVVEYWNKKVAYMDSPVRPVQLLEMVQNYKKTIWAACTNNPIKDVRNFAYTWNKHKFQSTFWGINITSLLGDKFVAVGDERATELYPTVQSWAESVAWDPMPLYHPDRYDASIRDKAKVLQREWMRTMAFFDPTQPGGSPVTHPTVVKPSPYANSGLAYKVHKPYPVDEGICMKCHYKDTCPTRQELWEVHPHKPKPPRPDPKQFFNPPYPIHPSWQLEVYWRRIEQVPLDQVLTASQQQQFIEYRDWYYNTYTGTYSKYELELAYREANKIPSDKSLNVEEEKGLIKYIKFYRDHYQRVLSDDELEVIWRTYTHKGSDEELTLDEKLSLARYIAGYRDLHGHVPNDDIKDRSDEFPTDTSFLVGDYVPDIYWRDPKKKPQRPHDHSPVPPFDQHHALPPVPEFGPPYPVLSNIELANLWRRMHHLPEDSRLTDTQLMQVRAYLMWYRETYPGTYSALELEQQWRDKNHITDTELTEEQKTSLKDYIDSYRSLYLPVLTDREIEITWRTQEGISLGDKLDEDQIAKAHGAIKHYRLRHGRVPSDQITEEVEVGQPFTGKELDLYKRETSPAMEDVGHSFESDIGEVDSDELLISTYYPPLKSFHLCPNLCHMLCNPPKVVTSTKKVEDDTYVLSKEFYLGSSTMEPFERLVYDTLTNRDVDPERICEAVARYLEWDDDTAFYRELLSLYLIDKALYWIRYHS